MLIGATKSVPPQISPYCSPFKRPSPGRRAQVRLSRRACHVSKSFVEYTRHYFGPATKALGIVALERAGAELPAAAGSIPIVFAALFALLHFVITLFHPRADSPLMPLAAMLCAVELVFVLRLRPDLAMDQLTWIDIDAASTAAMLPFFRLYPLLAQYQYLAAVSEIVLLALTAVFGKEINGARLWLSVGGFQLQNTEARWSLRSFSSSSV